MIWKIGLLNVVDQKLVRNKVSQARKHHKDLLNREKGDIEYKVTFYSAFQNIHFFV